MTSVVNFLVPMVVYIIAVRRADSEQLQNIGRGDRSSTSGDSLNGVKSSSQGSIDSNPSSPSRSLSTAAVPVQSTESVEVETQVLPKAEKPPKRKLSISGAVEWLKAAGSGKRPVGKDDGLPSGLQPSPLHHFSFSTASTAKESELSAPTQSPATPVQPPSATSVTSSVNETSDSSLSVSSALPPRHSASRPTAPSEEHVSGSPVLKSQALRWAAQEDQHRAALAAQASGSFVSDPTQPMTGSLRLARPPSSTVTSASSSRQNLLAGLTSSFTSRSPRPESPVSVEMTPTSSAERPRERKVQDSGMDDTFDVDEIHVEEVGVEEEEEEEEKVGGSPRALHGSTGTLPAIDEGKRENSQSVHAGEVVEEIAREVEPEDDGEVWHVVKPEWLQYRVKVAVVAFSIMVVLCVLALEQQIQLKVDPPSSD